MCSEIFAALRVCVCVLALMGLRSAETVTTEAERMSLQLLDFLHF